MGLILAKEQSSRLTNKNTLDFHGQPMFLVNVKKCLKIFPWTYVSSDSMEILKQAKKAGAIPILRSKDLCGDTPNIPVYQHAFKYMNCDGIVAVQANSPTIKSSVIEEVKRLMEEGKQEVMTCHKDQTLYGSVWGIAKHKLQDYGNPYKPIPDALVVDISVDIHTLSEYNEALRL